MGKINNIIMYLENMPLSNLIIIQDRKGIYFNQASKIIWTRLEKLRQKESYSELLDTRKEVLFCDQGVRMIDAIFYEKLYQVDSSYCQFGEEGKIRRMRRKRYAKY